MRPEFLPHEITAEICPDCGYPRGKGMKIIKDRVVECSTCAGTLQLGHNRAPALKHIAQAGVAGERESSAEQVPSFAPATSVTSGRETRGACSTNKQELASDIPTKMGFPTGEVATYPIVETPDATTPQILPISQLHRHRDGYITFSVGSDDDFRPLVAIRGDQLETYFPEFIDQLLKDGYVGINAGYRLARYGRPGRACGYPKHDSASLRYLCACYVDIDFYKLNVDFGTRAAATRGSPSDYRLKG